MVLSCQRGISREGITEVKLSGRGEGEEERGGEEREGEEIGEEGERRMNLSGYETIWALANRDD